MKSKIVHCSKIPGLKLIDANRVDVCLEYSSDSKIKSFSIMKLDLSGIELPPEAKIELACETSLEETFYPLGTVANKQLIQKVDLSEYKLTQKPKFRIIIFILGNPKLLAATDTISVRNSNDDSYSQSLLPVNCVDNLGERLWKLQISDMGASLNVNNNPEVSMIRLLEENVLVRGMILPEVVSQVLDYIMQQEDTSREWMIHWQTFAAQYGVEDLLDIAPEEDEDERNIRIDKIVSGWCKNLSLCEQIIDSEKWRIADHDM